MKQLRASLDSFESLSNRFLSKQLKPYRDDNGYLFVPDLNNEVTRFPVIGLRNYQEKAQQELFAKNIKKHFRIWPRRSGKEVWSFNMLIQGALERPGLYMIIYPTNVRGRMVLWDGAIILGNGNSLKFLDMIPANLIASVNQQEMSIKLTNGSVIRVLGSDTDPDKLRGINVLGAVLSEYAYSDPRIFYVLKPIFMQNNGWIIIQTTFNGKNHAYRLMETVKKDPEWSVSIESVETLCDENGNRYITDDMIESDRKDGMPEYLIQQEYYSTVEINEETLYFATEIRYWDENEKIKPGLIIPNAPVYTFWDIGYNDSTAILLVQFDHNHQPVIIKYIEDKGKILEFYIRSIREFCIKNNLMVQEHFVPHDGQKTDFNTGKNTVRQGADLGEQFRIVPRPASKFNAIQSMRRMCYRVRINKENTIRFIECMSDYQKEFDKKLGIYKDEPLHNWASHGVDAFQTLTLAIEGHMISERTHEVVYYN